MVKSKINSGGIVYSTNPSFNFEERSTVRIKTLLPAEQDLKIKLETKHRAGKAVSLITGLIATVADKEELCKKLKICCGTGGAVKGNEIIIQGDNREKILKWLEKNGYSNSKIIK